MSRTRKDRPYWVRSNDPNQNTRKYHSHVRFGRPVYKWRVMRDENGNPVTETKVWRTWKKINVYTGVPYVISDYGLSEEAKKMIDSEARARSGWIEQVVSRTFPKREQVFVGYMKDYCTIDEPETGAHYTVDLNPCSRFPREYYRNRPHTVDEKRAYHSAARAQENTALKNATKYYNSGEDIEDYGDENVNTRLHRHKGWWD